jgi:membrane protease subunit (stomatin/prohibitin family)
MAATIPADLAQFYGFVIRTAQELAYIYGWDEIFTESSELDASTESQLILFIGVMSGVGAANGVVTKLFGEMAMKSVAKRVTAKALTKTWYYPIVKKISAMLGQRMVKATFAKGVSKTVPILGGAISGGLTLATFKPMAYRLKKHLSTMAHMSPEEFAEYEAAIVVDAEDLDTDGGIVEVVMEEAATNCWVCTCGVENKGKFCPECGKAKPAGIPQYKCDKCGLVPDDKAHPPKFCPECGDPFDDGDIVLV